MWKSLKIFKTKIMKNFDINCCCHGKRYKSDAKKFNLKCLKNFFYYHNEAFLKCEYIYGFNFKREISNFLLPFCLFYFLKYFLLYSIAQPSNIKKSKKFVVKHNFSSLLSFYWIFASIIWHQSFSLVSMRDKKLKLFLSSSGFSVDASFEAI